MRRKTALTDKFYTKPPFYTCYVKKLCCLKQKYPFLRLFEAGRSLQGRKIYALFLGNTSSSTLYAAAFHAQEWLTELLCLRFLEEVCEHYCKKGELYRALSARGAIFLPLINPDGVELALSSGRSASNLRPFTDKLCGGDYSSWQANVRGVDINHNFDAGHSLLRKMEICAGITGPAERQFSGLKPHSEPETKTLVNLCRRFNISRAYALHSQGEEIFYRYGSRVPVGASAIARLLSDTSGYSLPIQSGLASHGGFKDWFIKEMGRPAFTIEIGRGKNPLPINELSPIFARLYETLMLSLVI